MYSSQIRSIWSAFVFQTLIDAERIPLSFTNAFRIQFQSSFIGMIKSSINIKPMHIIEVITKKMASLSLLSCSCLSLCPP